MNDSGGLAEARRLANEWVSKLTGVTAVPLDKGWLAPKLAANEPDALMNLEGRHNVVAHSLGNLRQSADFAETRKQQLPAILINGWIGYFWWELRQDLEAGLTIKTCERCGNVIRCGHRDRRFCTRDEDIIASGPEIAKRNVEGVTCWARVAGGYIFPDYLGGKKFTDLDW